jgi:hypothetical protein
MERGQMMENTVLVQPLHEWKKEANLTNYYFFSVVLWGENVPFSVSLEKPLEDLTIQEKYLLVKTVTREINWIECSKKIIIDALIEGHMLELAEDWVSSAEEVEGKEECYEVEDGQQVQLPISEADFAASLFFNSLGIDFESDLAKFSISIFFECSPDYFAGHSINVSCDPNHKVEAGGLFG